MRRRWMKVVINRNALPQPAAVLLDADAEPLGNLRLTMPALKLDLIDGEILTILV